MTNKLNRWTTMVAPQEVSSPNMSVPFVCMRWSHIWLGRMRASLVERAQLR